MLDRSNIAVPLRRRPMQPADVDRCVDIVAMHPVIGPRYGEDIEDLGRALRKLLGSAAVNTVVFERIDRNGATIVGVGFAVFVRDAFIREIKTPPLAWIGPELARRIAGGDSPVLTDDELRDANSGAGLNEIVWQGMGTPEFAHTMDFYHHMVGSYVEEHRGFLFKEMITVQAESAERLLWVVEAGGLYWNPARQLYETTSPEPAEAFAARPHIVGLTRELESVRPGSWIGTLFNYRPPQFGFSRGEQQLLQIALKGLHGTDQELASALHLSVPTIKKMWGSIYRRVADRDPGLVPDSTLAESGTRGRGREKRRTLLAYVRDHPEELRLHSPRLLRQNLRRTVRG
jgi:DNA-binding CsgD family transcriptional regulator